MSYQAAPPPPYGAPNQPVAGDPGTLDLPYYGIGFIDAVKRALAKYARFDGRASRSEYWWWVLGVGIVGAVLGILLSIAITIDVGKETPSLGPLSVILLVVVSLLWLAVIVPNIAIAVRRLHDQNMSGLMYLLVLIPSVGGIIIFVLMLMPSKPEGARFDRVRPQV